MSYLRRNGRTVSRLSLTLLASLLALPFVAAPGAHTAGAVGSWRNWQGTPAMVSNLGLYRAGEFIYQDYLYDDHGPNTDGIDHTDAIIGGSPNPQDPAVPPLGSTGGQIRYAGDFMYPSPDGRHFDNVADLIEFRVARDAGHLFYRWQLGALVEPDSTVIGMCVDEDGRTDTGLTSSPHGARLQQQLGCDRFYTVFGTGARVTDRNGLAADIQLVDGAVRTDLEANTIELRVPLSVADPGTSAWRYFVGAGLWDAAAGSWLQVPPGPQVNGAPTATGGSITMPQIWDLLSNNDEPNTYWREEKQANDLASQNILEHYVTVDFGRLAQPVDDPEPQMTGVVDRIYVSSFPMTPREGIEISNGVTRNFVYNGAYQPYSMVVPSSYYNQLAATPEKRFALDLCMHPLNGNDHTEIYYAEAQARRGYNPVTTGTTPSTGYLGFTVYPNLYDRLNKLYACVNGRGEGVGYTGGNGLVDYLEVKQDIERRYRVDVDQTTVHGISLGAIGTWYVSQLYPDQYSAAMPYIFSPGFSLNNPLLSNLYNLPVMFVVGTADEFGQAPFAESVADQMTALGNEHVYYHMLKRAHELSLGDEALPFTERLMYPRQRVTNPARVRYTFDPARFSSKLPGTGAAYWVSGMKPRSGSAGTIDVTGLGRADELPRDQIVFEGLYVNSNTGEEARFRGLLRMSPEEFAQVWRPAEIQPGWQEVTPLQMMHTALPAEATANAFRLTAADLSAVTLDTARMRLDPRSTIGAHIQGDGALTLTLLGRFPSSTKATLDGQPLPVTVTKTSLTIVLPLDGTAQTLTLSK